MEPMIAPGALSECPFVVFWDFDWSMIDENTDTWIFGQLSQAVAARGELESILKDATKIPIWTDRVTEALRVLHMRGVGKQELLDTMKTIPFHSGMKDAVTMLHSLGAYQIILSDSNTEFIKCILDATNLYQCINEIITNPAMFDEDGRLIPRPHQPRETPHGCLNCPPQLCKGIQLSKAIQRIDARRKPRILYIGDGIGDFCPSLQLGPNDVILPRKDFPLFMKLTAAGTQIRAKILPWKDGAEALDWIRQVIQNHH